MKYDVAYLGFFQKMYLSKDVFLIPYYLAKKHNMRLRVVYGSNMGDKDIPNLYRGVTLVGKQRKRVNAFNETIDWLRHILPVAKKINSLFFCGCSTHHMFLTWLLLKINPDVSVIVFGDMEEPQAKEVLDSGFIYNKGLSAIIKRKLALFYFTHVKFTVANECAYRIMQKAYAKYEWNGLVSLYPCLDDEMFHNLGLELREWKDKDNIMLYVGRIGNEQKNTDMLLDALSMVNLYDWKIYLVGPITDSFEVGKSSNNLDITYRFFEKNPHLQGKVFFTGMIYDQKEIFDYYIRAKVFLLTSRHEGFANVLSQAAACGCYFISTDVGGAETASNEWKFGTKIPQEDSVAFAKALQDFIEGKTFIDESHKANINNFMYSTALSSKQL